MKVLFAAAESVPFLKTGGLADVVGSLPRALSDKGLDVRVIMPNYSAIPQLYKEKMKLVAEISVPVGWRNAYCGVKELKLDGITYYFVDNEQYFSRSAAYGYEDDGERFAFLCRAVLEALSAVSFYPEILHCHDWHTGMIPALLKHHYWNQENYSRIKTVYTIHNLQYQGNYPYEVLGDLFGLPEWLFTPDGVEFYGQVSFMKAGIQLADRVTTVSPSYADEIRTPEFGYALDGALRNKGDRLIGIVNGIDAHSYNPESDSHLAVRYKTSMEKKEQNKTALQEELGLPVDASIPLIGMIGRMVEQKGLQLVLEKLDELLLTDNVQVVLLGSGDPHLEHAFREAEGRFRNKLISWIGFDEGLARRIYAASDLFLMPSLFEPCGISQLLALRYGSIPIVREVGGLKDTVHSYNEMTGEGNGFSFASFNSHDMLYTVRRALRIWSDPIHRNRLVEKALKGDYSWGQSAQQYEELYRGL
ncbi:glycogen synthase GlgA [Paenibacillus castaneae]|uniref:glycogen synthase GlgA n=1 Tax=Paenibacillus castaneae TaxID=474957 RepID=UPI000C9D127E|nr:glycogen synthase GlgA [Paenibacillus castaneae]